MAIENFERARHPVSIVGPTIVGPGKIFQNRSCQKAGKCCFEVGSCK